QLFQLLDHDFLFLRVQSGKYFLDCFSMLREYLGHEFLPLFCEHSMSYPAVIGTRFALQQFLFFQFIDDIRYTAAGKQYFITDFLDWLSSLVKQQFKYRKFG